MRYFYFLVWALLSVLVAFYMWPKNNSISEIVEDTNKDKVVVIDEVKGSEYTQSSEDGSNSNASNVGDSNENSSNEDNGGDFRKEGKAKYDFLEKVFIEFEQNKTVLPKNPKFASYLDSLSVLLNGDYIVELIGHTDNTSSQNNYEIGLKRANYIKDLLLAKGVDETNIIVDSKGDEVPRMEGDTPEAHARNRRVELFLKPN